jgi:hypothetical protein
MAAPDDVSAGGIGLIVSGPQAVGEVLQMAVLSPHPLAGRMLSFQVCRCLALNGGHRIAGPFLRPLPDSDVQALAGS